MLHTVGQQHKNIARKRIAVVNIYKDGSNSNNSSSGGTERVCLANLGGELVGPVCVLLVLVG